MRPNTDTGGQGCLKLHAGPVVYFTLLLAALFVLPGSLSAIERRKDQFRDEPAYLIVPLPYEYPGIGSGWLLLANVQNMGGTHADLFGIWAKGEAEATAVVLDELHVLPKRLLLEVVYQDLQRFVIQNYETRGMDTDKNDYNLVEINDSRSWQAELRLTFFDRKLEFFAGHNQGSFTVPRIRDAQGDIIVESDNPYKSESEANWIGLLIDHTDDRQDPRRGFRFRAMRRDSPRTNPDDAEYFVMSYDTLLYIPVGSISTLVLNYFRSDAVVTDRGNIGEQAIRDQLNFQCNPADPACLKAEQDIVDLFVAQRKHGESTGLGGLDHLRSYPTNRFNGGHSEFYGAEFRWNLTEEFTPFDYFIWKDTRTGVQIAFFWETGTVAETRGELWDRSRESYGAGLRMVTGSGSVYRIDYATGDEGEQAALWFFYPWG